MKMFECGFADQGTFLTQQTRSHETALYVECCDLYFSFFYSGLGTSLVTIPGIFMINDYFETWKATAMGLCCIGQGVAMLAAPPLMLHLFTHYGHQWGLLLIAALCLHGCVGGALFRQLQQNSYMNGKFNSHRDSKKRDCNKNGSFSMDLLLNVNFLSFVILMLALNFCNSVLSGLLPALAVENDLSLNNATLILALMGIGDIFGSPLLGFILDRECLQGSISTGSLVVIWLLPSVWEWTRSFTHQPPSFYWPSHDPRLLVTSDPSDSPYWVELCHGVKCMVLWESCCCVRLQDRWLGEG